MTIQRDKMAVERLFDMQDIQELLNKNAAAPYGKRNLALIIGGTYWGLTPYELSVLDVKDVVAKNGELYSIWTLPAYNSYNGEARENRTKDHVLTFFKNYLEFRIEKEWGLSNLHSYMGLDPESKFFLNDRGEKYKLSLRNSNSAQYQAQSMSDQLRRMIEKTNLHGATPSSYRDSYIKILYENGCHWNDLKLLSGIKQKRTLERKIRPKEAELEEVFRKLYSRVKNPI